MTIEARITVETPDALFAYAAEELRHFLSDAFQLDFNGNNPAWNFHLQVDSALPAFAFAVKTEGQTIQINGHDTAGVLHAIYTLLEQVGYRFEITGPRLTSQASLDNLRNWSMMIQPAVQWRGIRQHINFPMDISSYPLEEALDYIRNLARLRMNHITFHSYPDQWYAVEWPGGKMLAGGYFYGQRHDIPDHPMKQVIRNEKTFCIPAHEPFYDQPEANSKLAIDWLQQLMTEAKRVGMRIQFSFELRDIEMTQSLATVDAILKTYPLIDVLEIVTQESGEWGYAAPLEDLQRTVTEYFGAEALQDEELNALLTGNQKDLDRLIREIGHAVQVMKVISVPSPQPPPRSAERGGNTTPIDNSFRGIALPELSIGVYCTVRADHAFILKLMQQHVPEGIQWAFLLDHGNRAVARNLRDLNMPRRDWERTMMYSWIEFDGTMYLFQNAVEGVRRLVELGSEVYEGAPIHAMSFNHWRTAENRTCARYTAEALLQGALPARRFYHDYAQSMSIREAERYATAMALLDDADSQARDELPNVGFCYAGVWGVQGLGYFGVFRRDRLMDVRGKYERARENLRLCAANTSDKEGQRYLAFLDNRLTCTIVYLQSIEDAVALQGVCGQRQPAELNEHERQQVRDICDQALAGMEQYMALHAQAIEDRGCEGTLISFYYTPPTVLKRIRSEFGGTQEVVNQPEGSDAPPSPIWSEG